MLLLSSKGNCFFGCCAPGNSGFRFLNNSGAPAKGKELKLHSPYAAACTLSKSSSSIEFNIKAVVLFVERHELTSPTVHSPIEVEWNEVGIVIDVLKELRRLVHYEIDF